METLSSIDITKIDEIEEMNIYISSLNLLDELQLKIQKESSELSKFKIEQIENIPSCADMDSYDYLFAAVFGIIGAVISSSDLVKHNFDKIHTDASKEMPDTLLGKLLNHNGDSIDQINGKFIKRDGSNADLMFHRLLWGHDPLSFGSDNPFALMMQSNGKLKAIFNVFQHLVADIFSKQGLPVPGHSFFDQINSEGKLTNQFAEISKYLANNNRVKSQDVFSRMFTIRAQDIAAQGFVWAACNAYIYARKIKNSTRIHQIKIMSYCVNFFAHAGIGAIKQGGVPYINWAALSMIIKEIAYLYIDSYKEIRRLEKITDTLVKKSRELIENGDRLETSVFKTGKGLISHTSYLGYVQEFEEEEKDSMNLVDFFEEG
jgi:hypothetical protein